MIQRESTDTNPFTNCDTGFGCLCWTYDAALNALDAWDKTPKLRLGKHITNHVKTLDPYQTAILALHNLTPAQITRLATNELVRECAKIMEEDEEAINDTDTGPDIQCPNCDAPRAKGSPKSIWDNTQSLSCQRCGYEGPKAEFAVDSEAVPEPA